MPGKPKQPATMNVSGVRQIQELLATVRGISQELGEQYAPDPISAVAARAEKPFRTMAPRTETLAASVDGRGRVVYVSDALVDTKGYTAHNCFVGITLDRDNVAGEDINLTLVFEGSCGSAWVELDAQAVVVNARGNVTCPLLARDSLALATRFKLYASDARADPPQVRQITFSVDGMLTSGQGFS